MKNLILLKECRAIQLGHLYEHIFCAQIDALFLRHHLFQYLDYHHHGMMYYGGIVYIELEFYTDEAITLAKKIPRLNVVFDAVTIPTAASQILAEKEAPLSGTGFENIKKALEKLHAKPWQKIDDFGVLDTKSIKRTAGAFYLAKGDKLPARKLTMTVGLDSSFANSHRSILPLFRQVARLIIDTTRTGLTDKNGYYSFDDYFKQTHKTTAMFSILKVAHAHGKGVNLASDLAVCLKLIGDIKKLNCFKRLLEQLANMSYYDAPDIAINAERSYQATSVLIGSKGWQQIATEKNVQLILKNTSLELKFGREKVSQNIPQ